MAKVPLMDRKTISTSMIVLHQWCYTEYYTFSWWRVLVGCLSAASSCRSLETCPSWSKQTVPVCLVIICDCLWTYKGFSTGTDLSSAEASESRSKHDWTHRVGSQRWLELATACSNPPTDAQCNYNAHALSCTNFVANVGAGQLVLMVARSGHGLLLILGCALWIQKWKR